MTSDLPFNRPESLKRSTMERYNVRFPRTEPHRTKRFRARVRRKHIREHVSRSGVIERGEFEWCGANAYTQIKSQIVSSMSLSLPT
jgi:hypothetical protein